MITILEDQDFDELISNDLVLVDFYADWCGPCQMLGPILEELNNINIIKVDIDKFDELTHSYGVMSVPTLIFFKNGAEIRKEIGYHSKEELETIIKTLKEE